MAKLFYPPEDNGLQKTLDSDLATGITASLTLNNVNKIQNKPGVIVIDRIDSTGALKDASDREYIIYSEISGLTLTGLERGSGGSTDQDHGVGAVVEFVPDVNIFQSIADAMANLVSATDTSVVSMTDPELKGDLSGTAFLDEDTMSSDSATKVASQQSIKAYVNSNASITSSATPSPTGGAFRNSLFITALAAAAEFAAPSGTPVNGNMLMIRVLDDGTARALTWNAIYDGTADDLPSTTVVNKTSYILFMYSSESSKWEMISLMEES